MRLHRLAITAFGPFAGSEEVNLDALASSGLFLIHGPTGAGKTSILDAICFALYAAVPGARTGARASLRSDHAPQGAIPEVTLEFTAAGRRLRVCRSPEFSRPKKRGIGETTVPAKVVLDELVGNEWKNRGTRNDEVALVIKDILGMGLEQFIKVVLLPQGDFAAFLRASPEERRSVLEKLFDTQRFTEIETWLAERRRQTSTAVGMARDKLSTGLLRVDDVIARLDDYDDIMTSDWSEVPQDEIDTVLAGLVTSVDGRASTALASVEIARSTVVRTESALHLGNAALRHQETAAQARSRLAELDDQRGIYEDAARLVELSERASAVSGFVVAVKGANKMRAAALIRLAKLRQPLSHIRGVDILEDVIVEGDAVHDEVVEGGAAEDDIVEGDAVEREGAATMVRSLIAKVSGHSDSLQQVVSLDRQADSWAEESARHRQAVVAADEAFGTLTHERDKTEVSRAAAETNRDSARAAVAEIPALEARCKNLARIQKLLGDQERSAGTLEMLQGQAYSAEGVLLDLRSRLLDLRERRLAGLAAELADGLDAGDPCPVCGSGVHPAPAMTTDVVNPAAIQAAEVEQSRASESLSLIRSDVSAELARREARSAELATHSEEKRSGELGAEQPIDAQIVLDALAAGSEMVAAARATASALPDTEGQLTALALDAKRIQGLLEQSVATRVSSLALAESTQVQSQTARAEVTKLLANHGEACPCQPSEGTGTEVAERTEATNVISVHRQTLDQLRSLAAGLDELVTYRATARDALLSLSAALQANGLHSMQQAETAVLSPVRVAELTALLRACEQQRAQATALLAQPDVMAALKLPRPDVEALAEAHTQAATALTTSNRWHTLSEQAQTELRALSHTVHEALSDLGPAREEAQLVQELADCTAGSSADNALRMRLSSYVLAARLAEIATLANERLTTMSDGRYTLEYSDARAAKGARSGLGLVVRDAWTGRPRETSSLSGGEAFMASLALALGMGDAVRAEAGGFDLQTLFVDEGFGSLDDETLEQVMAVLDTLREGGRAVGIVSHVTELRARIPHQLHVIKQQAGSRIHTLDREAAADRLATVHEGRETVLSPAAQAS